MIFIVFVHKLPLFLAFVRHFDVSRCWALSGRRSIDALFEIDQTLRNADIFFVLCSNSAINRLVADIGDN